MRPYLLASFVAVAACVSAPAPAFAQGTGSSSSTQKPSTKPPKPPKPPAPKLPVEFRLYGVFEPQWMSASQSFDGVTGSPFTLGYGGGFQMNNAWKKLFFRGGFTFASASGERGFGTDDGFVSNGIATSLKLQTIEFGAGWRMPFKKRPKNAFYFGGSGILLHYSDSSDFAVAGENVSESFTGIGLEAGYDMALSKRFAFSLEGQYRIVPSNPPTNSVQAFYGESDLGGLAMRAMFSITFGKKAPTTPPKK